MPARALPCRDIHILIGPGIPVVGRVGGFAVFFGDERDNTAFVPLDEEQTNIQAELRASLRALEGRAC